MVDVSTANVDALKGMSDVEFDFGVSSAVKSAFRAEATKLSGQRGSRATYRTTGLTDFKGHFSTVFRQNGVTQLGDLDEVADTLQQVTTKIEELEQAAREENQRRQTAREWAQRQADRNGLDKWIDDHVTGGEDPPAVTLSETGPAASVPQPARRARQTPTPGAGGGGGGGTSSARPSNLRSFASSSAAADGELSGSAGRLQGQCTDFATSCKWATLDATGPIQGLRDWLRLNGEDSTWATTVADAFKQAGGEGTVSTLSNQTLQAALAAKNVPTSRRDIEVDPPTGYGSPPTTGYSNDPVNTSSGNFTEFECDLAFTGAASLQFTRNYNSLNASVGAFGRGWSSWADVRLTVDDEAARLRSFDGREIVFPRLGTGWDRAAGENLWLAQRAGENGHAPVFRMTSSAGLCWEFGADGRLQQTGTGPGSVIRFDYDAAGRLSSLTHERGRWMTLGWDEATERIREAVADDGRRVRYDYDGAGRLTTAVSPSGDRRYRWNSAEVDGADLIEAVVDADGVVEAENTYDEYGRVLTQRSPFGRTTRFVYLPGGVTEVSDSDGQRSNTWICDSRGRLIGVVDAEGNRQSTSYDRHGNPVVVTGRDGSALLSFYDGRGRRVRQVTPAGADTSWTYDNDDRPVSVTVSGGYEPAVTRYRYEGESRDPAEIVDAEHGITRLRWADGLLTEIVDPEGVALHFAYDQRGDLVATTDAEGNVARLERDQLGRVTAAVTPLGHRTTYRYAAVRDGMAGPLVSRQDPEGGIWRYEHTAAGRLTAVTDPTGGRTEIEHGDHGERSRTVDPLGRALSSAYDDLGNLTRVELPDAATWEFGHDALSRLVETTDAGGGRWRMGYDTTGGLTVSIDPTGVRRSVQRDASGRPVRVGDRSSQTNATYDALGRVVAETGADGGTSRFRYDRCGRLVEQTDSAGGVTRIERDRAGRARHITHPEGSTFSYEYDSCGRRAATIDTDGSRYAFDYDADGRLVRELWPTGEQARVVYDAAGRAVERFEPGRGTTRFGYDAAGRLVRTTDSWHGPRRFRYDAAGQLVEAVNALGGVTRFDYDLVGHCVAVVDPLGGRTERAYDAMGRLVAETDPLGRTTRWSYDAAGRQLERIDAIGSVLSWTYDDTGRLVDTFADGSLISTVERDFAGRTMTLREGETVHELAWDAAGRMIRRMRGGVGLSWTYDGDGRRTSLTGVHGEQTRYSYDAAGRVSALEVPELGRVVIERDAIGRIVSMAATGLYASWTWDGGALVRLEVSRQGRTQVTEIERDDAGRVVAESVDGVRTAYVYDPAGQLVEVRRGESVTSYGYDGGGRLVRESTDGQTIGYVHDAAGQLLARRDAAGKTEFRYDEAGRRVGESGPSSERRFGWDPRGFLRSITTITRAGDKVSARTQRLSVDALGELAGVDDEPVMWDSAAGVPALAQVGSLSVTGFGPLTGLLPGDSGDVARWLAPDWRPGSTGADPWDVTTAPSPELPSGVAIGGRESLLVGGLEWLQARAYDPASRGFLSTDPLDPVLGSGWAGNPYSFAGNDPRNASDPWGLRPVTDQELQGYRDANNGSLRNAASAATDWVANNWEYIAAGAMIVGGVALMCTGIGGPAGLALMAGSGALISAGASAAIQKHQNGSVDWGQVAVDGAIGGVAGLAGGGAGVAALRAGSRAGMNCLGRNVMTGAAAGMAEGGVAGGLSYATSGQPLTVAGLARATGGGMVAGGLTGGAAGGALTKVSGAACFVAGTRVLLGDGSSKAIEDVVIGDEVLAADPDTGGTVAKPVVDTYVHHDVETFDVETTDGIVTSTAEHPFYVDGLGWTPVRDLTPGDKLVDSHGALVELVVVTPTGETATVHNLHVDGLHNYHVQTGEAWVRVHNDCYVDLTSPSRRTHILDGEIRPNGSYGGGHRAGTGYPNKSEFPASWSDDRIIHEISDVATDPVSATRPSTSNPHDSFVNGTRDGIDIEVFMRHDQIWSGYPTNVPRNP